MIDGPSDRIPVSSQSNGSDRRVGIARNAAQEGARLVGPHLGIVPFVPTDRTMAAVTSIDGAVMIDPEGTCHGIGLILDGEAGGNESAARGPPYNSAGRYLRRNADCLIVVVSEDGMIDVMPSPGPTAGH